MSRDTHDRRTYDVLRLLDVHEPIGSVRLTDHLRERGYSITERTVRLTLADLDDAGFTEKAGGKGRRLTEHGRAELRRGGVWGRTDHVSERLAELTSRVTYDPATDEGTVVVGTVTIPNRERETLERILARLDASPLGPINVAIEEIHVDGDPHVRVAAPSSVTIDGVLLAAGIDADLETVGIVEYRADPATDDLPYDDPDAGADGGAVVRYTDAIGGERATFDVASVLIGADRTDVGVALDGGAGLLVADYLEFPLAHVTRASELATATRDGLGGVVDVRRPREPGPFPWGEPSWSVASLTHAGAAECLIARCVEGGIAADWETLARVRDRAALGPAGESG